MQFLFNGRGRCSIGTPQPLSASPQCNLKKMEFKLDFSRDISRDVYGLHGPNATVDGSRMLVVQGVSLSIILVIYI